MRNYKSRKRIFVTGGAGFLGSHLIDRLPEHGNEVFCADNLFTGTKRNIEHLLNYPCFEFLRHDIIFPLYIEVDQIYNLACPSSPIYYHHDPVQAAKTSVRGVINMRGLAKRLKARFSKPVSARFMATRRSIPKKRTIEAMSILSARAVATTKASNSQRLCSSNITVSTGWTPNLQHLRPLQEPQ